MAPAQPVQRGRRARHATSDTTTPLEPVSVRETGLRAGGTLSTMPQSLPLPPPGFDALPVEDQIDYVQSLWDRIAATAGQVPLQEWQQALLDERLAQQEAVIARILRHRSRPWVASAGGLSGVRRGRAAFSFRRRLVCRPPPRRAYNPPVG
jgi:putative addiction module component (TIGR02574 family)